MTEYIKKNYFIFLLYLMISAGLCINVFQCFYVPDKLSNDISALSLWSALLLFLLFTGFYNRKTAVFTASLLFIIISCGILLLRSGHFTAGEETGQNNYLFYSLSFIIVFLVFFLGQSRLGILFLLGIGILTFFMISVLRYNHYASGYFAFLTGAACLFFLRGYQKTAAIMTAKKTSVFAYPLTAFLLCLTALFLSIGVYFFVIRPIHPPCAEPALITKLKSLDIVKKSGIYSVKHLYDDSRRTSNTNDSERTLQEDTPPPATVSSPEKPEEQNQVIQNHINPSEHENPVKSNAITYQRKKLPAFILFLLIPSAVLLLAAGKRTGSILWYRRLQRESRQLQIVLLYQYFLHKLSVIGYRRKQEDTLYEFLERYRKQLSSFTSSKTVMHTLTDIYVKVFYGREDATEEEYTIFLHFYREFHKNLRRKLGWFRYGMKFLFL